MKSKKIGKQIGFSADRPIESGRHDSLGRKKFANDLAKRIQSWRGGDSLVIALCGEWGCGKTSLKNMIVEQLVRRQPPKVDLLEFAPWEISGHGSVAATFFRELEILLKNHSDASQGTERRVNILRAYSKLTALSGTAFQWVAKAMDGVGDGSNLAIAAGATLLTSTSEVANQAAEAYEAKAKAEGQSLGALKKELSKEMENLERPVLIVIDDIDRLTSDEIREVFQLVKANANFPNLIYLLMFDREIVCGALNQISGGRGHEFLDKIVQVLFHVPQPQLKDVHKVLHDGLESHLSVTGVNERWDKTRWSRLWLDGLAGYFTNLRSVYRFLGSFGFQVNQMRSGDTFEVNPLDLIAIESLRLFEPSVYEAIAENRVLFVGRGPFHRLGLEEDTKTSTRTNLDRILRVVPDARRGRVSEILKQLFPVLFGHQHPDGESLLRQLRVGHHLMFDRYFTLSIANDDVSQAELDTLRKCIENSNDFAAVCSTLANQGKLELAFERLDAYKATFPTSAFPAAITTLCDIGDSLPYVPFSSAWGLKFDPLVYVWRIVHFSLKSIQSENSRYELLRSGIAASQGVRVAVEIVQNQERVGNRNEEDFQITQEHCEDLKLLALQRLRSAAVDGRLHDMPGLTQLLGQWKAWGSESEVRQWLVKNTQDSTGALWFLRLSMSKMQMSTTSRAKEIHYINLTDLSILGEIDKLATLTQELKIDELGEDDRRALRAYRHALIWKEEGKPAAYYGGDDGPLSEDV